MKLERTILWIEGIVLLGPLCLIAAFLAITSIGIVLMTLGELRVFLFVTLPFIICLASLTWVSTSLFGYLKRGESALKRPDWLGFIGLVSLSSIFVLFGVGEVAFGGARGWEQSVVQYWPERQFSGMFAIGVPAILPTLHVSYLYYKANR